MAFLKLNISKTSYGQCFYRTLIGNYTQSMVPLSMTLIDLWPGFKGHDVLWSRISEKRHVLQSYYCTWGPNIWNGTIFGDLEWPLNASRGFVSVSWASCCTKEGHPSCKINILHQPSFGVRIQLILIHSCIQKFWTWSAYE